MATFRYPLQRTHWQPRALWLLLALAALALALANLPWSVKGFVYGIMALGAWRAHRRWSWYPLEMIVSESGVALRHPAQGDEADTPSQWQSPLMGEGYVAIPSRYGWWLITRENMQAEDWHALRLMIGARQLSKSGLPF